MQAEKKIQTHKSAEADMEAESGTAFLPDRLMNPGKYEPMLPTTEEHTAAENKLLKLFFSDYWGEPERAPH